MRSLVKVVLWFVAILSVGTLLASVPIAGSYEKRAVLAQRVQVDKTASSLFGDGPEYQSIGSPQWVIVDDPQAFIDEDGQKLLDDGYLKAKKIYPLQRQTVRFVARNVQVAAISAMVVSALGMLLLRRFKGVATNDVVTS